MNGRFIVFEGPDGAGTSLHSRMLAERLEHEGHDVLLTMEPTDGPVGTSIREILRSQHGDMSASTLQLLFSADRSWHIDTVIQPALAAGKTVICDRFTLSTLIYGQVQGLERSWLEEISRYFPKPDVVVLTLPPVAVCLERVARRATRDMFEKEETLRNIHAAYAAYATEHSDVIMIDTSGEKQIVSDAIHDALFPKR